MKRNETLKIRTECPGCSYFSGDTPETAACAKGNTPTCFRKKKQCKDWQEKPDASAHTTEDGEPGTVQTKPVKAVAYTDGSYNKATGCWGYGVILMAGGKKYEISGSGKDQHGGWQIEGEITGALEACEKALELGCKSLEIRYDYEGIACWALGSWRAKKSYTAEYAAKMRKYMQKADITFTHVKAHTGIEGNEAVDGLAKKACGIYAPQNTGGRLPAVSGRPTVAIPSDVNPECRDAIKVFYKKKPVKFGDYIKLKTYGMDPYSRKPYEELLAYAEKESIVETIAEVFENGSREFCTAIRWAMRGLKVEDAIRKVQVDAEVSANCMGRR